MAFFNLGKKKGDDLQPLDTSFGNPPPPSSQAPPSETPVDRVVSMRQSGMSNNEMIQDLQRQGYNSGQIFDAINQADAAPGPQAGYAEQQPSPPGHASPPPMGPPAAMPPPYPQPITPPADIEERVEEVAEAIIDEKWNELVKNINKVIEWKEKTESRIAQIEQKFNDIRHNFDVLHKSILGKIGEYDQNILNLGSEIKAMEKVFQKMLPTFTENVNELSRITSSVKKKRPSK